MADTHVGVNFLADWEEKRNQPLEWEAVLADDGRIVVRRRGGRSETYAPRNPGQAQLWGRLRAGQTWKTPNEPQFSLYPENAVRFFLEGK